MLLSVRDLESSFFLDEGELKAVDGISFDVDVGETVGLVGESGCGKTIVALSIVDLIQHPGRVKGGRVALDGRDVLSMSPEEIAMTSSGLAVPDGMSNAVTGSVGSTSTSASSRAAS